MRLRPTLQAAIGTVLVAVTAAGCSTSAPPAAGVRVVTTTAVLAALARPVVGGRGSVTSLIPAGDDPHTHQPSARDRRRLLDATLAVTDGAGLEEGLADVIGQAQGDGVATLVAMDAVAPLRYANGELDPHFWLDPVQAAAVVAALGRRLAELDPARAGAFARAARSFEERLAGLAREVRSILAPLPASRRLLVSNHDAYRYLARRFGLQVLGSIVPGRSSAATASPGHLAELAATVRERHVCAVFSEVGGSTALAESLAREAGPGVAVVPLYAGTLPGSYSAMLRDDATRIRDALGTCP